jgi:hypothetical protein
MLACLLGRISAQAGVRVAAQPDRHGQLGTADRLRVVLLVWWAALALVGESGLERKAPPQHASRYFSGAHTFRGPNREHRSRARALRRCRR